MGKDSIECTAHEGDGAACSLEDNPSCSVAGVTLGIYGGQLLCTGGNVSINALLCFQALSF